MKTSDLSSSNTDTRQFFGTNVASNFLKYRVQDMNSRNIISFEENKIVNKDLLPMKQRSSYTKNNSSLLKLSQKKSYKLLENQAFQQMRKIKPFSSLKLNSNYASGIAADHRLKEQNSFESADFTMSTRQEASKEKGGHNRLWSLKQPPVDLGSHQSQNKINILAQLTKAIQKIIENQIKLDKEEEHVAIIRDILTRDLVVLAVESLYIDRIKPLLIDVFQRIKHNLKALLFPDNMGNDMLEELLSRENYRLLCEKKEYQESSVKIKSIVNHQTLFASAASNGKIQQKKSKAIEVFNVFMLYIFIQSECSDIFTLEMPETPASEKLLAALEIASSCQMFPYNSYPTIPALSQFVHQTEVLMLQAPQQCLPWVDPHDPHNPYSELIWRSFGAFLTSRLTASSMASSTSGLMPYQFKGGRYGLALKLQKTEFPALRSLSLGELCHLVQLAIGGRMLAYENSVLQPVASCVHISGTLLRLYESYSIKSNASNCNNESDLDDPFAYNYQETNCDSISGTINNKQLGTCSDNNQGSYEPLKGASFITNNTAIGGWGQRPYYDSVDELAEDLNSLLKYRPDGIVTAQLKKTLLSKFGKDIIPQHFGYKKLTECLVQNPVISKVCQVICSNPPSDCLLLIQRKNKAQKTNLKTHYECIQSPGTVSTVASSLENSPDNHLKSYIKKKAEVQIPAVTLTPVPALMSITFNAWAAKFKNNDWTKNKELNTVVEKTCKLNNVHDKDDGDILEDVRKVIEMEARQADLSVSPEKTQLNSVYGSYWDCFLLTAETASILVT